MKVDFNKTLKNAFGEDLVNEKGEVETQRKWVSMLLYSAGSGDAQEITAEEKMMAFSVWQRVYNNKSETELSAEECSLIKKLANGLTAGGMGQIINNIECEQ